MKKWLALIFVSAFVGSVASAQWLVYDYKANIKRLDTQLTKVKYSLNVYDQKANTEAYLDTATAKGDGLKGFLMIPICVGCNDEGTDSALGMASWLYLMRTGDKSKAVWKFETEVNSGIFAKKVAARFNENQSDDLEGGPTSLKGLNEAWMSLFFDFATPDDEYMTGPLGNDYVYGFLGIGSTDGYVYLGGFGKVTTDTQSSVGVCGGSTSNACYIIASINGSLVGDTNWTYVCGPSMWDMCTLTGGEEIGSSFDPLYATMDGSWSIKLNKNISKQVNAASSDYSKEVILVNKLGGKRLIGDSASAD